MEFYISNVNIKTAYSSDVPVKYAVLCMNYIMSYPTNEPDIDFFYFVLSKSMKTGDVHAVHSLINRLGENPVACFVQKKDFRMHDQGTDNGNSLFLSAGKLSGIIIASICKTYPG